MTHRTPFFLPWLYPSLVWRMPFHKELYLTFDDGPVSGPTEFVLDTLKKFNAMATFFCIGENIRKHPEVFEKIVNRGHSVGNHTFNHWNGWKTKTNDYRQNVILCRDEIETHISDDYKAASKSNLFRPPYGKIKYRQIGALPEFKIIMWDVLTMDYNKDLSPEKCLKNSTDATRSGSIIVFHDSYKAEKNLMFVLPRYIEYYSRLGYTFKAIV